MYRKTTLKNGFRIMSEKLDHLRSLALGIWVNSGSRDEIGSESGLSHFIEHMSFKGTRNRSSLQIAKELDAIGGLSNAFTGKENTCFHGRVLGKHFHSLAEILSDILLNSTYNQDDMERERQVILQEISMVEDTPDDHIHVLLNRLFWPDHPVGRPVLGIGETISAIEKETILRHMDRFYSPERIVVVAAGDVDHDDMVSFFEPLFDPLKGKASHGERNAPKSGAGVSVHFKDLEQVHICLGGEAPSLKSRRRYSCAILSTILGGNMSSRLFQEIRENRGLAYSVYSFVSSYVDAGLFGIYLATDSGNVNLALETIQSEIRKISKGELSRTDLEEARDHLIGGLYLASESAENRMMRMAKNEFLFNRYVGIDELVSSLEQVTVDDVVEIAGRIFLKDGVSLVTLGPIKEEDLDTSTLAFN
ncbi:MAG: insulinase family protein [Deltaproteobacteria bacterium]|nr:insulinase family protein [Deltaproteobacteria bacterium]